MFWFETWHPGKEEQANIRKKMLGKIAHRRWLWKAGRKEFIKEAAVDDLIAPLLLSHQQPENKAICEDSGFARFSVSDWWAIFCSVLIFSAKAPQNVSHTLESQISEPNISLYNYLLSKMPFLTKGQEDICALTKTTSKIEIPLYLWGNMLLRSSKVLRWSECSSFLKLWFANWIVTSCICSRLPWKSWQKYINYKINFSDQQLANIHTSLTTH